jgi:hypothetical protein
LTEKKAITPCSIHSHILFERVIILRALPLESSRSRDVNGEEDSYFIAKLLYRNREVGRLQWVLSPPDNLNADKWANSV